MFDLDAGMKNDKKEEPMFLPGLDAEDEAEDCVENDGNKGRSEVSLLVYVVAISFSRLINHLFCSTCMLSFHISIFARDEKDPAFTFTASARVVASGFFPPALVILAFIVVVMLAFFIVLALVVVHAFIVAWRRSLPAGALHVDHLRHLLCASFHLASALHGMSESVASALVAVSVFVYMSGFFLLALDMLVFLIFWLSSS